MLRFNWIALLCALTIGVASIVTHPVAATSYKAPNLSAANILQVAASRQTNKTRSGCHVHNGLLCCPGGCVHPRKKRQYTRAFCHPHGDWICCPGLGCVPPQM
jgi:hypothetical protein